VGVNGDVAGADFELLEQNIVGDIFISLEADLADLVERAFADDEGNVDPFLVGGVIQGEFIYAGVEISFFAEVGGYLGDVGIEQAAIQISGRKDEDVRLGGDLRAELS